MFYPTISHFAYTELNKQEVIDLIMVPVVLS